MSKKNKNLIKQADEEGRKAARRWLHHDQGKDLEDMKNKPEKQQEQTQNAEQQPQQPAI